MAALGEVLEALGIRATKHGREWQALCPSPGHDDRKPSWSIRDEPGSPKHGFHGCFACGFKGGLVGLVVALRGCSPGEARAFLDGGAEAPPPEFVRYELRGLPTHGGFQLPWGVVFEPFSKWPPTVLEYAASRGVTGGQIDAWGLGYALTGPLAGRIVLPKRDVDGVLRGYTARAFGAAAKRYLEPHENEGADMSVLFGEVHWNEGQNAVVVTEGALNALAYARVCPYVAVAALSGASNTGAIQAAKIAQRFDRVYLATDPDRAGDRSASEIKKLLARYASCIRIELPSKQDAVALGDEKLSKIVDALMGGT